MLKKIELPVLKVGIIFTLVDGTWGLLFPEYYAPFKGMYVPKHVARIKIMGIEDGNYRLMLMELSPEEGRLITPSGVFVTCALHDIELALVLSNKKRK